MLDFLLMVTCASATMFFFITASYILSMNKREKREYEDRRFPREW